MALAATVAVYASVGLARTLSDELRNRGLLDDVFFAAFAVLVALVIARALLRHDRGRLVEVFAVLVTAIVCLMLVLRMASPLERSHLLEYGVIALLIHEALRERAAGIVGAGLSLRHPALASVGAAWALGTVDECIQIVVPSRVFDPVDIGVNALAAAIAVGASEIISRLRRVPAC